MADSSRSLPQEVLCRNGQHYWGDWSPFRPAKKLPFASVFVTDVPPRPAPIEAYRWRHCDCGASEGEAYHGERRVFSRDIMARVSRPMVYK